MSELRLTVNGGEHVLDAPVGTSLAHVLREELGLTGTKIACNEGHCGACTVQVDGVPRLSCITLAHTVEGEVTTIEGLREHPLVDAFVRADAVQCGYCTPGQVVSAAALVAANPRADARGDPARDGREHLPLRHVSQDRGGDSLVARLIRTEKEVEGRFEEVWIVVEEDPLEQWPEGPLAVVGRPAPRKDGHERVRGEARYTADLKLPGMLHAAVLRSPHAHAKVRRIDLAPALALPGVRAAIGPGEAHGLEEEAGFSGAAVAAVAADTFAPGARGGRGDRRRVGGARGRARSGRGRPARAPHRRRAATPRARRRRAGARRGGRRGRGDVPHADRPPQLARDPPGHLRVAGRHAPRLHLDPVHLGHPAGGRRHARPARGQGARRLRVHGRRLRLEERPRRVHVRRRRAREADGAAGALRAHAARGAHLRRQPQRDDPAAPGRRAQRRDDRRARRRVHELRRLVGLERLDRGADADALRLRERPHRHVRRAAQHAADEGVPRARLRRGDVRARVPGRRARGEARRRPARAAAPQLRELERGHAVLLQEPRGLLPPRRAALGAAARGALAVRRRLEARRRDGEPDLVRRRRASLLRVGAARLRRPRDGDHGDAGHRHRDAHRDGADRGRGARAAARARRGRARRLGARAVRLDLGRLLDAAVDGAGGAGGRGRCEAAGDRDRGAALRPRAARARHPRRQRSSRRTATSRHRSRRSSACSRRRRSSARAPAGRTRPG